jgi:hypothetical protein
MPRSRQKQEDNDQAWTFGRLLFALKPAQRTLLQV